eukprot:TRINITY_DN14436_c1_g1_i1.p1 TRINITY_DN14436_c1_g1~~TRINITY_DN14436_c1_g1_i1.p1  ORF type:complete len:182 (+),score=31.34 TRINITY_DN14436_c1_g1_i1:75-620(+)
MACGCGASAARALARTTTGSSFRNTRSTSSSEHQNTCFVTCESLSERVLEGAILSDNAEEDCEASDSDDASDFEVPGVCTRTVTLGDLPDPSQFMSTKWMDKYVKLCIHEDDAKDSDSDSEFDSVSHAGGSNGIRADVESDCDEMYLGPLQSTRTITRRAFPSPSEYLTETELSLALKFYE